VSAFHPSLRMTDASGLGPIHMSRKALLDYVIDILIAARRGELDKRDYDLAVIGLMREHAKESDRSFEPLQEAANRTTKHTFRNRTHRGAMSNQLRFALLDLVWAHSLGGMSAAYRSLEKKDLSAHEREVVATLFVSLVHIWATTPSRTACGQ
jgi:hypothetical protein